MSEDEAHVQQRQSHLGHLLDAVKQCQIRFGGRKELATETDPRVSCLCSQFEAVLQHGLRPRSTNRGLAAFRQVTELVSNSLNLNLGPNPEYSVFWHYVREHLTRHEYERYLLLNNINTDIGRGRAWLRSALNEHSLERYMHMLVADPNILSQFYEDWAFLMDQERSSMLPVMAAGLGSILFAISINNPDLNQNRLLKGDPSESLASSWQMESDPPPLPPSTTKSTKEKKKKRKVLPHVVSFDEDGLACSKSQSPMCSSAPATCLNSPTATSMEASQQIATWNIEGASASGPEAAANRVEEEAASMEGMKEVVSGVQLLLQSIKQDGRSENGPRNEKCGEKSSAASEGMECASTVSLSRGISNRPLVLEERSEVGSLTVTQTLTPVNNAHVGELIPLPMGSEEPQSEEDSISVPSYSEEMDTAASALAVVQRVLQSQPTAIPASEHCANQRAEKMDSVTLSTGELKQALLIVLAQKEELVQQSQSLRSMLNQEVQVNASVRQELEDVRHKEQEKLERAESKLQALNRENELLKHQLKKYVGAVQMLRRDGSQAHETLASLEAQQANRQAEGSAYIDYHYEATEYEKKLIQVAEMHGELMEFNERLQRLLQAKEATLRRLREELVDLRGPLPDEGHTSDEDALSVTSDYDTGSLAASTRALINIWIPSAFLTGGSSDVHHVYQVFVRIRDDEWNVYRRYAQFYALHKELKKKDPVVNTFDFPPKKTIGNKDARFVEERRKRLQHFIRCIVNHLLLNNLDLVSNPSKDLLIACLPFFGEMNQGKDGGVAKKRTSPRNPFRFASSGSCSQGGSSPQYTGL